MKIKQSGFILVEHVVSFLLLVAIVMSFAGTIRQFNQLEIRKNLEVDAYLAAAMLNESTQKDCQLKGDWYRLVGKTRIINITKNLSYEI
ncbi:MULTISPECIES: hypothetical protein [Holzapfeliella]